MFEIADEVAEALEKNKPVVALESSIIAHGLPHPFNLETANAVEDAVRHEGAVPATVGIVDGVVRVGLSPEGLRRLAAPDARHPKVGAADIAPVIAQGLCAGTTVSATAEIAERVGIRLFATGGIGGVHRGDSGDVSADLTTLATKPIAVVSAGPKSILDLHRTFELLETLGALTIGYRTDELPAFYSRRSGISLDHRVDTVDEIAEVIVTRFDVLGQGGVLVVNPVESDDEISADELAPVVDQAIERAEEGGVGGKELTPFLLSQLRASLGQRAVRCNQNLVLSNARLAARIAVAVANRR